MGATRAPAQLLPPCQVVIHKWEYDIGQCQAKLSSLVQKSKWKARNQILTRDAFVTPKLVSAPARLLLSSHAQQVWLSMFYVSPENYLYNFGKFWLIGFARIRKENWPTNLSAALLDENFTEKWTRLLFYFYGNWNRNHLPIPFSHHLDFLFNLRPKILFVLMSIECHVM